MFSQQNKTPETSLSFERTNHQTNIHVIPVIIAKRDVFQNQNLFWSVVIETRASIHASKPLIVEAKLVWAKRLSNSVQVLQFGANTKGESQTTTWEIKIKIGTHGPPQP